MTELTITTAFARQVAAFPDHLAVIADDGVLTYRQLAARAAAVAVLVRRAGGDQPVALVCRHGATMIAAMLGVLFAGRAYVPLDPTFPRRRLAYQLADSGAGLLLTDTDCRALADELAADTLPAVDIDPVLTQKSTVDIGELDVSRDGDAPAYLLYTSGSTGMPKGVWQNHRNVVFAAHNHIRDCAITPSDRISVLASFGFDMAVTDTYSALLSGAAAVPVDIRGHGLHRLTDLLTERGVTLYHSTPTVYRYLVASLGERRLPDIRVVLLGGEEVTSRDVRLCRSHFGPNCVFVNGYGATEISFIAQNHISPSASIPDGVVPVGSPLAGIEVVLIGDDGQPHPTVGEILVRSKHVALGYHGQAGRDHDKFGTLRGERTYRTGDLARRLPDGMLVFQGRADRQVKIRGHRVELGEVETQLAELPGVAQAAATARRVGANADLELVGYVVPAHGYDAAETTAALRDRLPDYMMPRAIVALPELPLTVTGKLDLRALPEPSYPAAAESELTAAEQVIADHWCQTLALSAVGRDDHFFELGGHSLLMALMQPQLEHSLGRKLSMATLFAYPTVGSLAAHLASPDDESTSVAAARAARRRQARVRRAEG